jgi:hypothetical protein
MTEPDPNFEVLTTAELLRRYRAAGIAAQPVDFDEAEVPVAVRHLIPLAHIWGEGDDVLREQMENAAPREQLVHLKRAVSAVDDDLDAWLTSPEALGRAGPTAAYLAFTNLRMVADGVPNDWLK